MIPNSLFKFAALAVLLTLASALPSQAAMEGVVLVETEGFANHGGWVLDQQFMDIMGSPYLLAHGLGEPVADAETTVNFAKAGKYRLHVRTMDWVARWNAPGAPGKFEVLINGQPVKTTFGTQGAAWHWQDGGVLELPAGPVKVALHDLTGFNGRCDALVFSAVEGFVPPNELKAMELFRRQALGLSDTPREAGSYDLVVAGGGIAGMCAALSAARLGLSVALVQDRPVLGGNNSSEVRVWLNGNVGLQPYPRIGDVVKEIEPAKRSETGPNNTADIYEDAKREALVRAEKNIKLFLEYRVNEVETADKKIKAVIARNTRTGERIRLAGRLFSDCTGDGTVGTLAGADHEITPTQHMGPSNLWNVVDVGAPAPFPRVPWALDLSAKTFPGRSKIPADGTSATLKSLGKWFWETGFDWDPLKDTEQMRDYNLRAMFGAWDALKNVDKVLPNHKITWAAYVEGKRESVRLLGDVILTAEEFVESKPYEDGCFPCTWSIDLHYPEKRYRQGFEGNEFISYATTNRRYKVPYWAPYRTLYSRNISNLFMAGRNISVTHDALGAVRVMRTCGMMGEVVGMAASLCIKAETSPRGVYKEHLDGLKKLMEKGVGSAK